MKEKIHIYHTNDVHSHFNQWPKIKNFLRKKKKEHEAAGENVFIFDCGDFVDRWHPFTEGTMGKGNVKLLNEVGYTAVTIGNNEGITLPHNGLNELYDDASFDVIVANLYLPGKVKPTWCVPYQIYETARGTKIGVTAVTAYYRQLYELLHWELSEPFTELEMQLNHLKEQTDMIILLSHLGIHDDEKIAKLFPQVDLILGGHTHHLFPNGENVNETMLAAAGRFGEYVGYVQAEYEQGTLSLDAAVYETRSLQHVPEDEVNFLDQVGRKKLGDEITTIPKPLTFAWNARSDLPIILCEALREWCKADCAIVNSGLILSSLSKGKVTKYDVHRMLPHPINPCTVKLTGAELQEVLYQAEDIRWLELELKGLGFRGRVMGKFVYEGIEMDRLHHLVEIAGKPLDPKETYTLATTDMFTFGRFFPEIQRSSEKQYYMPEFLRDVMAWKLQQLYGKSKL